MTQGLKLVFAGTPQFAATALTGLINSHHELLAVYTQPDKPSGRGLKLTASPVKELALAHQIPVFQPKSLKDDSAVRELAALNADVLIVAAYGLLLPVSVLKIPRLGCINIHPSLLPRWRGAAPIQRTIYAGDAITGVTIMQMDAGLDTGPILLQKNYVLDPLETSHTLHEHLAKLGSEALLETLTLLSEDNLHPQIQDNALATYAQKICKEEAMIDWELPAIDLDREIRAFNPWPVSYTTWQNKPLRIWAAKALATPHTAAPRTILKVSPEGIDIATGDGILRLLTLQLPGGKALSSRDFYNAKHHELKVGDHLV